LSKLSKLESDKINFDNDDYLVELKEKNIKSPFQTINTDMNKSDDLQNEITKEVLLEAEIKAQKIIKEANLEAQNILNNAQNEKEALIEIAKKEIENLKKESQANLEKNLKEQEEKIEQLRIEKAKKGYEEGHKDGLEKIQEELEEKIEKFDNFILSQFDIKEKILKSLNSDISALINVISKKILFKEIDSNVLDEIIKHAIVKLEKKENIKIILSENYAKILYENQKKLLDNDEIEFNFENFNQYKNFEIIYNPKFEKDTIIIENLKERLDASVSSQLDIVIRNIYEKIQNNPIDFKTLEKTISTETENET